MKWRRCSLGALIVLASACASIAPSDATISRLEDEYNRSRLDGDAKTLAALLDDRWTLVHVDGAVESKESYVHGIASGARQIHSIEVAGRTIRISGAAAVVTGEASQTGFRRGELRSGRFRFIHVWIERNGGWRMIVAQSTEIKTAQ